MVRIIRTSLLLLFFAVIGVCGDNQAAAWQDSAAVKTINIINTVKQEGADRIIFTDGSREYPYTLEELALVRMGRQEEDGLSWNFITCTDPALLSYKLFLLSLKINTPPVEAAFYLDEQDNIQVRPHQEGRQLDLGLLITSLGNPGIYREVYPLPIKRLIPNVTAEKIIDQAPTHLWAEYTTRLADIPDRTENVRVASGKLHGLLIAPGAEVSFNDIVGPREPEKGYRAAPIIVGGKFEPGLGGGVCQVSSTFYNAILLAGLKITERHSHSVRIAYVPSGRDATVVYGQKDLKFANTYGGYLLIKTKLVGLDLTISLYGSPNKAYDAVEVFTEVIKTIPPPIKEVFDDSLEPGEKKIIEKGSSGYITKTFRAFIAGGNRTIEPIGQDYYAPVYTIIAHGPKLNKNF